MRPAAAEHVSPAAAWKLPSFMLDAQGKGCGSPRKGLSLQRLSAAQCGEWAARGQQQQSMHYLQKPGKHSSFPHAACPTGKGAIKLSCSSRTARSGLVMPLLRLDGQGLACYGRCRWVTYLAGCGRPACGPCTSHCWRPCKACQPAQHRPVLDAPHPACQQVQLRVNPISLWVAMGLMLKFSIVCTQAILAAANTLLVSAGAVLAPQRLVEAGAACLRMGASHPVCRLPRRQLLRSRKLLRRMERSKSR